MDSKYSVSVESMEHQQVEIRGSQDVIGKINTVKANIDLSGINKSFEQDAKIYAYDRSGKKLDVEIIPDSVHVQCDVSSYSKEVSIVPEYVGQFESGYGLKEVTLSRDKVRIYGKEELLNSINSVYVMIDISGLSGDKTYEKLPIAGIEKINKLRKNHYKYYTNREWNNPENYDLCLNSDSLGVEKCAEVIEQYVIGKKDKN